MTYKTTKRARCRTYLFFSEIEARVLHSEEKKNQA